MDKSIPIEEMVKSAITSGDPEELEEAVREISTTRTRKGKRQFYAQVNAAITGVAFERGEPDILNLVTEPTEEEVTEASRRAITRYIDSADEAWISAIFTLVGKLNRKGQQSEILARISGELVLRGIDTGKEQYIERALNTLEAISIRKYRSEILSEIIPHLIRYGEEHRNVEILQHVLAMLPEISTLSERAKLSAGLARAIATVGMVSKDRCLLIQGLSIAAGIEQKIQRTGTISDIVNGAWRSPLKAEIADIANILDSIREIRQERMAEILAILTVGLLDHQKDRKDTYRRLTELADKKPWAGQVIAHELLAKAERSGDYWFLEKMFEFVARHGESTPPPIEDIVNAGIAIATRSGNPAVLSDIVPLVDEYSDGAKAARLYHQISETLYRVDDFRQAVLVLKKAGNPQGNSLLFQTAIKLVIEAIRRDEIEFIREILLAGEETRIADTLIQQALTDFCRKCSLDEVAGHIPAIKELAALHQSQDTLLLECSIVLLDRGFIKDKGPAALLDLLSQITDHGLREEAFSKIAIDMARIGADRNDRHLLQASIALACKIIEQKRLASTLAGIANQVTALAVQEAYPDLLRGMRILLTSLLAQDLCMIAMESIIQGLITYGVEHGSLQALDESARILVETHDPSLQHLFATLIEGYVRVGCIRIVDNRSSARPALFEGVLDPFETALSLLKTRTPDAAFQIRIGDCIDIMLEQMQESRDAVLVIPMALFSLEIENEYERTAMIQRILTPFTERTQEFDSADPYEATAYLLEGLNGATASLPVLDLMHRLFEHTSDLYARYSGIYRVASAYLVLDERERAESTIRRLHETINETPDPAVRAIMLSDLAGLMAGIDPREARDYLDEAEDMVGSVGEEREDLVRKHLIHAFREICAANGEEKDLQWAIEQAQRIGNQVDYVDALSVVYDMADEPAARKEILSIISQTVAGIPSVYVRLPLLFHVARFAETSGDEDAIELILESMERAAGSIRIPFIIAMTQLWVAGLLYSLYRATGNSSARERATAIASSIEDERIRYILTVQVDQIAPGSWEGTVYGRILEFRERLRRGNCTTKDVVALDRAVGATHDRLKRVIYYTEVYVFARDAGQHEIAERMLECALKGAGGIRPLSRRAIALGDMACRLHSARYEDHAGDLLDLAVGVVVNIRDQATRESIYDELDMSIRIIQEYWL